jgi:hypothetical protein
MLQIEAMSRPSFDELKAEIRKIWYWITLSDNDLIPLQIPAQGETRWFIFYGVSIHD